MKPRQPKNLAGAGRSLWRSIIDVYELRPDEVRVLEQAARTADLIDALRTQLDHEPLTTAGSMGQVRPNPLLMEIRGQRQLLANLLKQLHLPDEPGAVSATPTVRAQNAARARWGNRGA